MYIARVLKPGYQEGCTDVTEMIQALSIFKFGSMEIAVVSLPLWARVLSYPRPPRLSNQANIAIRKAVGIFAKVCTNTSLN